MKNPEMRSLWALKELSAMKSRFSSLFIKLGYQKTTILSKKLALAGKP
jgi:hypothetical protein